MYWTQFFNPPPSEAKRGQGAPAPGTNVEFLQLGPKGLRYADDIAATPDQLSSLGGDIMLDITPGQFRSGNSVSGTQPEYLNGAQLRLEIQQKKSFLGLLPILAWASVAAIKPDSSGKLPPLQGLDFTSAVGESADSKILLPGGMGTVALNVSVAKKPSKFLAVLDELAKAAEAVMPALGLPAISKSALEGFTVVIGKLEGRGDFLMSTNPPQEIIVTQEAWSSRPAKAIAFPPGDYLMFPTTQKALLQAEFEDLTIESGYLINKKADPKLTVVERADLAAKGLTYVTMRINASAVSATGAGKPAEGGSGAGGKSPKPKSP
jgi:hypothetical protein